MQTNLACSSHPIHFNFCSAFCSWQRNCIYIYIHIFLICIYKREARCSEKIKLQLPAAFNARWRQMYLRCSACREAWTNEEWRPNKNRLELCATYDMVNLCCAVCGSRVLLLLVVRQREDHDGWARAPWLLKSIWCCKLESGVWKKIRRPPLCGTTAICCEVWGFKGLMPSTLPTPAHLVYRWSPSKQILAAWGASDEMLHREEPILIA